MLSIMKKHRHTRLSQSVEERIEICMILSETHHSRALRQKAERDV